MEKKVIKISEMNGTNENVIEDKKNLYLLLNFSKNYISSSIVEYSVEQHKISILGYTKDETDGIFNGQIQNIDKVNSSLKKNLIKLKKVANLNSFEKVEVFCNISPIIGKKTTANGVVNFIDNEVTKKDINEVITKALHATNIPDNMKLINLKINKFKIDNNWVSNPLGMNCQRLEVDATVQIINNSYYNNFNKVLLTNGLKNSLMRFETDNIIDASLNEEEKELGAILIYVSDSYTKVSFVKNSELVNEISILKGKNTIIENISNTFKISFKISKYILEHLSLISKNANNLGYFEIEKSDGKVQSINFNLLIDTISDTLIDIFNEVKMEIKNDNGVNNYLNGLIFLKTLDIEGIDEFFNDMFKNEIKDIRSFKNLITKQDNILNVEMLNNEFALLGMINLILNEKEFNYNHNVQLIGDVIVQNNNIKNISELRNDLSNLDLTGKKESFFSKITKMAKELW